MQHERVEKFAYGRAIETVFDDTSDTIPTFLIKWKNRTSNYQKRKEKKEIEDWLKVRLNLDTVRVVPF